MKEYSIKKLITLRSLAMLVITIILVILLVFIPVNRFINNKIYDVAENAARESIVSLVKQFDKSLVVVGKTYNSAVEKVLRNYAQQVENYNLEQITEQQLALELKKVSGELNPAAGLKTEELKFHLINLRKGIIKSSHSAALKMDFANYSELWEGLNQLEKKEVIIQRLTYYKQRGNPKKYGYIKLDEEHILGLAVPVQQTLFQELSLDLKKLKQELYFVDDLALYDSQFTPIEEVFSSPTEQDQRYFKQLLASNKKVKKVNIDSNRFHFYTYWKSKRENKIKLPQRYLIKVNFDFSEIEVLKRLLLALILGVMMLVGVIVVYLSGSLHKRLVDPFSRLTKSMHQASLQDIRDLNVNMERTDIKEVNELLATYQDLAGELSASFEELEAINEELEDSYHKVDNLNKRLEKLLQMPGNIAEVVFEGEQAFLQRLLKTAKDLVPEADYGSIYTTDEGNWEFVATIGHDLEKLKSLPLKAEYIPDFEQVTWLEVDDILEYSKSKMPPEIFEKFSEGSKPIKSTIIAKLEIGDEQVGGINLDLAADSKQEFRQETLQTMNYFSNVASAFMTMQRYSQMQKKLQKEIIFAIIGILELHDKYTKGHSENVADISAAIAQELDLESEKINQVYWAGLVHDIGKILIDKDILNKPSGLSEDEYSQIKKHTLWGAEVLNNSDELKEIAEYIRHHHEHWDGSGYPDELEGNEIPLISQIIGVADAWDAMRSNRIYRNSLSKEVAIKELKDSKGKQFDPVVVDALLKLIKKDKL